MGNGRVRVLGCSIDCLTMDETVARCIEWTRGDRRPHLLVGANASIVTMMQNDTALARATAEADLVQPDGMAVVWASRLLRAAVPEKVSGVDLMHNLLVAAGEHRLTVYFLGARAEVVRRLIDVTHERYPGAIVAGFRDGYFSTEEWPDVIREIRESGSDILFVGMPTPFKEVWCHEHRAELGVPVILGVGGSFDVHAGFIPRAPRWMQVWCLEWFWRFMREPRKMWKRYLVGNTRFITMVLKAMLTRSRACAAPDPGHGTGSQRAR